MLMYLVLSIIAIGVTAVAIILRHRSLATKAALDGLRAKHVLITGGSKGIGFELAKQCVRNGAHVTIVARRREDLDKAKLELIKCRTTTGSTPQHVLAFSADVAAGSFALERIVAEAETTSGPIHILACCAGTAIARTFTDTSEADFAQMMNINYFGTVNMIKSCTDSLKRSAAKSSSSTSTSSSSSSSSPAHILLFSSLAGLFGMYGYSAYSASKFALVGLAECLAMEFRADRITVTVSFPPDTATPGFELEQIGKPEITKIISEEGGLFAPEVVAHKALVDTLHGEFISSIGLNGFVLTSLCAGMMPTRSWLARIAQIATMSLLRAIGLHFLYTCERTIAKEEAKKRKSK